MSPLSPIEMSPPTSPGRWSWDTLSWFAWAAGPPTKGPGESERLSQHEPARIEPSGSHAAVESQTDQPTPGGRAVGADGAPGQAALARLPHRRGQGADLPAPRPTQQPST